MPNSTMPSTQEAMGAGREAEKLSQVVLDSLEEDASAEQLARRAFRSRAQFFRVFAALITFNTYQRLLALDALRRLGVKVEGFGCPTEYEATVAKAR